MDTTQKSGYGLPEMSQPVLGQGEEKGETEEERQLRRRWQAKQYHEKFYGKHPGRKTAYNRRYRETHRAKVNAMNAAWRKTNRAYVLRKNKYWKRWARENSEKMKATAKAYYVKTREKAIARSKAHYQKNKERVLERSRARQLRIRFEITIQEYEALSLKQKNKCAICHGVNKDGWRLAVDHDHASGQVRELLCRKCNLLIGHLEDSQERVRQILRYLKKHSQLKLLFR